MPDWLWIQNVIFPLVGMGIGTLFLIGVYRTVNHWIQVRHEQHAPPPELEGELAGLTERVARLEELQERVQDLEDRLDFTERVLARQRDGKLLPEGS